MSSRKSSRKVEAAIQGPFFLPLHQDRYAEALSTGVVPLAGMEAAALGNVDSRLLARSAHGFDYGAVGLLELVGPPVVRGYVLAADCKAFWLRDQGEADELKAKLGLFGDTVPDAIPMKVDSQLFVVRESTPRTLDGELDLGGASLPSDAPQPVTDTIVEQTLATLESLAGATSMTRHRCLDRSLGIEVLAGLLTPGPTKNPRHGAAASFAMGVMDELLQSVAREARASKDELFVIAEAAELISGMNPRDGMEPLAFSRQLLDRVARAGGEGAAAIATKLDETIAKLSDNQLELTTSRIDDTGQIGLRSLMVFLLAPNPEQALRWVSARKDIGPGVSILTSMFSGLYAGLGSVPRQVKAPDKSVFLATTTYAQSLLDDRPTLTLHHRWAEDGVECHAVVAGGHQLAAVANFPKAEIALLLDASRSAGLIGRVNPETGAITVGRPGDNVARAAWAAVGKSRWLEAGPVVILSCHVRQPGKAQCPRQLLERLLAPGLAPVWAALGESACQVVLSVEVLLHDSGFASRINDALTALYSTAEDLALCFPMEPLGRRRAPSKKFNVPEVDARGSVGSAS
jgi:hypothetical protein